MPYIAGDSHTTYTHNKSHEEIHSIVIEYPQTRDNSSGIRLVIFLAVWGPDEYLNSTYVSHDPISSRVCITLPSLRHLPQLLSLFSSQLH